MAHTKRPSQLFRNMAAKIAAIPMIFTTLVVFVGCTGWTVVYSFTKSKMLPKKIFETTELFSIPTPSWLSDGSLDFSYISGIATKNFVGLAQYERLWNSDRWLLSIENIAIYGICSLVFTFVFGFILAALLDQKIRFENTFRTIFLYPFALSFIVTGLVWQWILNKDHGLQQVVRDMGFENFNFNPIYDADIVMYGILIAGLWQGTGLIMCLMLAGLRGIDEDIWKAARIDGIPMWKTYIYIVIPMMKPIFATTLVLIASGIVKLYDLVVAQTSGGPGLASEVPAKYVYDLMFASQNLGQGLAASTMMLTFVIVVVIIIPSIIRAFGGKKNHV
ncbi:MAG: sugar ABC transporter permease [Rhodobacteraceae bacterium]|nr:sugar ABC transporter permease [Paracoccaceae bacterium]